MSGPTPGTGDPRDVWPLRQEMARVDPDDTVSFSAAEVLARLDDCRPVLRPDEGGVATAAVLLLGHLSEHYEGGPGREADDVLDGRVAELRRQIVLRADRLPSRPDDPDELQAELERERAVPPKPPQSTVPRAPVEALLAAWDVQTGDNTTRRDLAIAVAEVRRHLDTTTPEDGQR